MFVIGTSSNGGFEYLKLEDKATVIVPLAGLDLPSGEEFDGANALIGFDKYTLFDMKGKLPEGMNYLPNFVRVSNNLEEDPGAILGLTPTTRYLWAVFRKWARTMFPVFGNLAQLLRSS